MSIYRRPRLLASTLMCSLLLTGCAAHRAFDDGNRLYDAGQAEAGISRLSEAVRLDPDNVEYRLALATRRTSYLNATLAAAESARLAGHRDEARARYKTVLAIDPNNVMAHQSLTAIDEDQQRSDTLDLAQKAIDSGEGLEQAESQINTVLAVDAGNTRAQQLLKALKARRPSETAGSTRLASAFAKPVTLDFREAPISAVFDMIGKSSGLNFFFDHDVKSDLKTTITARNIPIENAVRVITTTNQLALRALDDSSLLIYPDTPQKQDQYAPMMVRTFHLANADAKTVSATLKTALNIKNVVEDTRLGLVIVRDTPEVMKAVERLIALEDQPDAEVMLDVEVLEVQRDSLTRAGITWPDTATLSPLSGSTGTGTTTGTSGSGTTLRQLLHLSRDTIQAQINNGTVNLHQDSQDSNILANPRIRVKSKEKAKVLIGNKLPVFTTTSTSTGFISDSVNYLDVGLKLEVQPEVSVDQDVNININLEVSTVINQVTSQSGTQAYQIGTRNANTVLRLRDGETQLLAGLINDQESSSGVGIPGLRNLPLLGRLFGTPSNSKQRSEIVLSITPHILRGIRRQDLDTAEFAVGTGAGIAHDPLHFELTANAGASQAAVATPAFAPPAPRAALPAMSTASAPADTSAPANSLTFSWSNPGKINPGDVFTVALNVAAPQGFASLPLTLGYDPNVLQAISVQEGDVLRKAGITSLFGSRIDPDQGHIQATLARQQAEATSGGAPLAGSVVELRFKALRAAPADISLLESKTQAAALPVDAHIGVGH